MRTIFCTYTIYIYKAQKQLSTIPSRPGLSHLRSNLFHQNNVYRYHTLTFLLTLQESLSY